MNEQMKEWTYERMNKRMNGLEHDWMNERNMKESNKKRKSMDRQTNKWMNG